MLSFFGLAAYALSVGAGEAGFLASILSGGVDVGTAVYLQRFVSSAVLFGMLPLGAALISGIPTAELGLARPVRFGSAGWFFLFLCAGILIGFLGSLDPLLSTFYPYRPGLDELVRERGIGVLFGHIGLYLLLYYLPWEFLFRGILVVAVTESLRKDNGEWPSGTLLVALLQTAPSTLLHMGHPSAEVFGAVVFGAVAGYLALESRSIYPGLVFHAASGIALDLFIVVRGSAV